jgi:hypothetical protein
MTNPNDFANPNDLFWLARYAYHTLNPLVDEAKAIEPSTQLSIELTFGHGIAAHTKVPKLAVAIHWGRDGMLALSSYLIYKTDVDLFADALRTKINKLKAPVEEERRNPWTEVLEPVSN